ncbi:VOC family protein [Wenjunlia tyrosinilytica]|uniref:Hydroxylase n=1 Tax=Wenjunlia tyrosinilytica TaxID=1544741 RepID=A0A917ZNE2_9ACTN|nr:VOC family protein [Wenjunlia tyrosinilytica]GGO87832.1 hydroxylase [Wenjunlia tyrosinilytica]
MLTTSYVPGAPGWIDLGSPDTGAAADFYGSLFGWELESAGPQAGGYGMFRLGGRTVAALGPLTEDGAASAWTVYFHTPDADATTRTVEQAGGAVRFGPFDVFTAGRMAGLTDPDDARFAVWQPGDIRGLGLVTAPGSLCWTELYTPDPALARRFYHSVFGWEATDTPFAGATYTVLSTAGRGREGSFGGMVPLGRAPGATAQWLPYFEVEDCDRVTADARSLGGRVTMPTVDAEDVGRFAHLADPFGAAFAVITSAGT